MNRFFFYISSETSIDIEYFSRNVLRKNLDQTITGQWSIYEIIIEGDVERKKPKISDKKN